MTPLLATPQLMVSMVGGIVASTPLPSCLGERLFKVAWKKVDCSFASFLSGVGCAESIDASCSDWNVWDWDLLKSSTDVLCSAPHVPHPCHG